MRRFIDIRYVRAYQIVVGDAILKDNGMLMYVDDLINHNGRVEAFSSEKSNGFRDMLGFGVSQVVPVVPLES